MDSENTVLDSGDSTTLDDKRASEQPEKAEARNKKDKKDSQMWRTVTIGGVSGIVLGAMAGGIRADAKPPKPQQPEDNPDTGGDTPGGGTAVENNLAEAASVDDSMSFSEAFASARAEVGPGGVFEWRGNLYGTYYATEWDNMSSEEKSEYNSRVNHHIGTSSSQSASSSSHDDDEVEVVAVTESSSGDDEAEVISASLADTGQNVAQETGDAEQVEVLGVEYDEESDMNVAYVNVEDQEVILIDTTGDEEFNYLASDINHDNQITPDEVLDISGYGINVDSLGGFTDISGDDNLLADICEV